MEHIGEVVRRVAVWPKYSCGAAVVVEQAAEPLSTANRPSGCRRTRSRNREEQKVVFALMVSLLVVMLHEIGHNAA